LEGLKKSVERLTGLWRPSALSLSRLRRSVTPRKYRFRSDGKTPNSALPVLHYQGAVQFAEYDPAAVFEALFASNGWTNSWRDVFYGFTHFHSGTHEVLGIARGYARLQLGGTQGVIRLVKTGDVLVLPAGTGHKGVGASRDLLVVGAYPQNAGAYDEPRSSKRAHDEALRSIARVKAPAMDPLYGAKGPLKTAWRRAN
jgi:uncharacterized protein YjlB